MSIAESAKELEKWYDRSLIPKLDIASLTKRVLRPATFRAFMADYQISLNLLAERTGIADTLLEAWLTGSLRKNPEARKRIVPQLLAQMHQEREFRKRATKAKREAQQSVPPGKRNNSSSPSKPGASHPTLKGMQADIHSSGSHQAASALSAGAESTIPVSSALHSAAESSSSRPQAAPTDRVPLSIIGKRMLLEHVQQSVTEAQCIARAELVDNCWCQLSGQPSTGTSAFPSTITSLPLTTPDGDNEDDDSESATSPPAGYPQLALSLLFDEPVETASSTARILVVPPQALLLALDQTPISTSSSSSSSSSSASLSKSVLRGISGEVVLTTHPKTPLVSQCLVAPLQEQVKAIRQVGSDMTRCVGVFADAVASQRQPQTSDATAALRRAVRRLRLSISSLILFPDAESDSDLADQSPSAPLPSLGSASSTTRQDACRNRAFGCSAALALLRDCASELTYWAIQLHSQAESDNGGGTTTAETSTTGTGKRVCMQPLQEGNATHDQTQCRVTIAICTVCMLLESVLLGLAADAVSELEVHVHEATGLARDEATGLARDAAHGAKVGVRHNQLLIEQHGGAMAAGWELVMSDVAAGSLLSIAALLASVCRVEDTRFSIRILDQAHPGTAASVAAFVGLAERASLAAPQTASMTPTRWTTTVQRLRISDHGMDEFPVSGKIRPSKRARAQKPTNIGVTLPAAAAKAGHMAVQSALALSSTRPGKLSIIPGICPVLGISASCPSPVWAYRGALNASIRETGNVQHTATSLRSGLHAPSRFQSESRPSGSKAPTDGREMGAAADILMTVASGAPDGSRLPSGPYSILSSSLPESSASVRYGDGTMLTRPPAQPPTGTAAMVPFGAVESLWRVQQGHSGAHPVPGVGKDPGPYNPINASRIQYRYASGAAGRRLGQLNARTPPLRAIPSAENMSLLSAAHSGSAQLSHQACQGETSFDMSPASLLGEGTPLHAPSTYPLGSGSIAGRLPLPGPLSVLSSVSHPAQQYPSQLHNSAGSGSAGGGAAGAGSGGSRRLAMTTTTRPTDIKTVNPTQRGGQYGMPLVAEAGVADPDAVTRLALQGAFAAQAPASVRQAAYFETSHDMLHRTSSRSKSRNSGSQDSSTPSLQQASVSSALAAQSITNRMPSATATPLEPSVSHVGGALEQTQKVAKQARGGYTSFGV